MFVKQNCFNFYFLVFKKNRLFFSLTLRKYSFNFLNSSLLNVKDRSGGGGIFQFSVRNVFIAANFEI